MACSTAPRVARPFGPEPGLTLEAAAERLLIPRQTLHRLVRAGHVRTAPQVGTKGQVYPRIPAAEVARCRREWGIDAAVADPKAIAPQAPELAASA